MTEQEKQIEEYYEIYEQIKYTTGCYDDNARMVADIIVNDLGYRKESEWISVEDRLPQEEIRVLVAIKSERSYTEIDTDRIINGKWVRWSNDVTHWQPLPELPKMKGEINNESKSRV